MDTFELFDDEIELPMVGRSLCIEALTLAKPSLAEASEQQLNDIFENVLPKFLAVATETYKNDPTPFAFDPFNITEYPLDEVLNGQLLDPFRNSLDQSQESWDALMLEDEQHQDLIGVALILFTIQSILDIESEYKQNDKIDYQQCMAAIDPYLLQLHNVCTFLSRLPSDLAHVSSKLQRKIVAKKGGIAKGNRLSELKEIVLAEAAQHHTEYPATTAAQLIYRKLTSKTQYLNDESGKPLLSDPEARFTKWIRTDRKQKHH